ncbi:MAG: hypothetical protein ACHQIL_13125 [Steroidobacterales bacterium]
MAVADRSGMQRGVVALALTLLIVCIWSLTHRYRGLTGDAELYALQAMAKLHPALANDIYLQNESQDRYTVFSLLYANLIGAVGLHRAALSLFLVFTVWFLAAAWALSRRLSNAAAAWLSVTLLVITVGRYGSYGVFHFCEQFLTPRLIAEALIVTALVCFHAGARVWAVGIAAAMLFIHPLMALPGLLLVICLWTGLRAASVGALAGICATALMAKAALLAAQSTGTLALIDGEWLTVVRERSQFLFMQLWRADDWKINALPFASLTLTLLAVREARIRQLAWAAMLVGATGLVIAWIACTIGPVAILLQGQAWRWMWIPSFVSILLLAPTLAAMWQDQKCGPACALVLLGGWTCTAIDIWAGIGLTLVLWLSRPFITVRIAAWLRWAALVLAIVLAGWTIANAWTISHAPSAEVGREPVMIAYAHGILGLQTASLALSAGLGWWISTRRSPWIPAIASLAFAGVSAAALPGAMQEFAPNGTRGEIEAYAGWRESIPAASNVLVLGVHNSAGFVWLTLDRPSYLSIDQSSGVVFSRATALEVRRRSEVLSPLVEPSWKIMTYLAKRAHDKLIPDDKDKPLTSAALIGMCGDTQLGFVIAREFVGFDPVRHTQPGAYRDWSLYDCRHVRALAGPA